MEKNKMSRGNKILYGLMIVMIILLFIPDTRSLFQQGLMKIGLFKPKLEKSVAVTQQPQQNISQTANVAFSNESGAIINMSDLKGKVVFINFWATWCGPCRAEMPSIQVLYNKFKTNPNIEFLLVEIERDKEKAATFMKNENLDMPVYFPEGPIPQAWLGGSIPSTVILNKAGDLVGKHVGIGDYSTKEVENFVLDEINK